VNVLFTSPGRRVELVKIFRENLPKGSKLYGADFDSTSPASYFLDKVFKVPFKIDDQYVDRVLEICEINNVELVIPLIDPELPFFSRAREKFQEKGIFVMISSFEAIEIASDKYKTAKFANSIEVNIPKTLLGSMLTDEAIYNLNFPLVLKPRLGSASKGIKVVNSKEELRYVKDILDENVILQEKIEGFEVTVDVFGTETGKCIEAVQRKRLKVRGGEVERGVTIKDMGIFRIVEKIVENYKPRGVINIQFIFDTRSDEYLLMEINPRFGGGFPLSYKAGANYIKLLVDMINSVELQSNIGNYKEGLYMLRYDQAVYTERLIDLC